MINVIIITGAVFIIIGLCMFASTLNIRLNGVHTKAVVVEIIRKKYSKDLSYYPVFEYNVDGQARQARRSYGSGLTRCYIGQEVEIICHGKEYEKVEVKNDYTMLLLIPIICIAMGALIIGFFS